MRDWYLCGFIWLLAAIGIVVLLGEVQILERDTQYRAGPAPLGRAAR